MLTINYAMRMKIINLSIVVESLPAHDNPCRLQAICLETGDSAFGNSTLLVTYALLDKISERAIRADKSTRALPGNPSRIVGDLFNPFTAPYWSCWGIGKPVKRLNFKGWSFGSYKPRIDVRTFPPEATLPR